MPVDIAAEVIANTRLSSDYNVLALAAPEVARAAVPGQFVMLKLEGVSDPLLRRPFSVFELLSDDRGRAIGISVLNKRIGPSTRLLYEARPPQRVACLGPLGRGFTTTTLPAEAWMVAGGVGLAPFATFAQSLRAQGVPTVLFYGARSAAELFYLDFFERLGVELVITTEDGSYGEAGRIIAPLERRLHSCNRQAPPHLYVCGPEGLLKACATTAARHGVSCEVSVERLMGCGMGGCYSCVVPMRDEGGAWHHVRSCLSGPVLAADRIVWE